MPGEPKWPWSGSCVDDIWLVVSTYPSEKWWTSSVGMILPKIWKKCSKPPTRYSMLNRFKKCGNNLLPPTACRNNPIHARACLQKNTYALRSPVYGQQPAQSQTNSSGVLSNLEKSNNTCWLLIWERHSFSKIRGQSQHYPAIMCAMHKSEPNKSWGGFLASIIINWLTHSQTQTVRIPLSFVWWQKWVCLT